MSDLIMLGALIGGFFYYFSADRLVPVTDRFRKLTVNLC